MSDENEPVDRRLLGAPWLKPSSSTPSKSTGSTSKPSTVSWDSMALQYNLPPLSELTALPPPVSLQSIILGEMSPSTSDSRSSRPRGFYEELLQSRPAALYIDMQDHPEKYDPEEIDLVEKLVESGRAPTDPERSLLDALVVTYLEKPKPPAPAKRVKKQVLEEVKELLDAGAFEASLGGPGGADVLPKDETGKDAFWWV